jgi:CBS domain containing-hemolysin-like protein
MRFFIIIFTPFNYLAGVWQEFIVRVFPSKDDRSITEDELLTFVEEVRQEGGINRQEEKMIRQVIEFDDITAAEIITPRIDVAAVPENSPPEEIDRVFAATGFSRLPVYRDTIDTITGVILLKDFHHEVMKKGRPPSEIVKPVVFVTKTMKISSLLQTLQRKQSHMAVLVDEFGGTLGIVTIEDIVEELVGEIWDEHEKVVKPFRQHSEVSFSVLGSAKFHDILEYIGAASSPEDADIPNTTVGSWILENTGSLPRAGDQITWRNLQFTVSRVQRHREMEVTVYRKDLNQKR